MNGVGKDKPIPFWGLNFESMDRSKELGDCERSFGPFREVGWSRYIGSSLKSFF